jgi:uncharacterized membrane protein
MMLLDITTFLGRMHPMIVHLPIGFLLLAALFEGLAYMQRYASLKAAVPLTLLLGGIFAILACLLGYLLSLTGDYDPQQLSRHKYGGILVAAMAILLYGMQLRRWRFTAALPRWILTAGSGLVILLMIYAGHQGANLTHGADYLSLATLQEKERPKPDSLEAAYLFEDIVQPLLIKRCGQCHGQGKRKGELTVGSLAALLKGGKSGAAIVPGDAHGSKLIERITLDPSNKKFMPTDGKTPLTKNEVALLQWWVTKGLAKSGQTLASIKGSEEIKPVVAALLGFTAGASSEQSDAADTLHAHVPAGFNLTLLDSLRHQGWQVRVMLHQPVLLDLSWPAGKPLPAGQLAHSLQPVAKNVIWLNLSAHELTDADLTVLPQLTSLEKLRLDNNPVGDGIGDQLKGLTHLEAVNLNQTRLSKTGLQRLQQIPSLKRIYYWQTPAE